MGVLYGIPLDEIKTKNPTRLGEWLNLGILADEVSDTSICAHGQNPALRRRRRVGLKKTEGGDRAKTGAGGKRGRKKRQGDALCGMSEREETAVVSVLGHLSEVVKRYQPKSRGFGLAKSNVPCILARIRDGATVDELKLVIDARAWEADRQKNPDDRVTKIQYLNPTTPFRDSSWPWSQSLVTAMSVEKEVKINGQAFGKNAPASGRKLKRDDVTNKPYFVDAQGIRRWCDENGKLPGEEGYMGG
jgi:hypothetical protein